jgi:hypothetical protein
MRFKKHIEKNRSTATINPQVRKTGVDAVHESCPQMEKKKKKRIVICKKHV